MASEGPMGPAFVSLLVCLAACGTTRRMATTENVDARNRDLLSGCLSPDGRTVVLGQSGVVAVDITDGSTRFVSNVGRVIYCDVAGIVTAGRTSNEEGVQAEVRVLDYQTGELRWPMVSTELPDCARMGDVSFSAGPTARSIGLSWRAMASWSGGYPPSPEEEAESHCDERGALTINRGNGRLRTRSYIRWDMPEGYAARSDVRLGAHGIEIVEDIHTIDRCVVGREPEGPSTLTARRDGQTLWTREVASLEGRDCVP